MQNKLSHYLSTGLNIGALSSLLLAGCESKKIISVIDRSPGYEIACYYFPNYHVNDNRNAASKGAGWSEWELVWLSHCCMK